MSVSYNGLWKLLIDKKMKKDRFDKQAGYQQQYGCQNDKRRDCFHEYHGENMR